MEYRLNESVQLTDAIVKKLIEKHAPEIARMNKLEDYYLNKNKILNRVFKDGEGNIDTSKPNNKVAHAYASYISDTLTGYFIGNPVTYNSENEVALATVKDIFDANDEADENCRLASDMSIFGIAYELEYVNKDGESKFKRIDPREVIVIFNDTLDDDILYVIRHYKCEDIITEDEYEIVEIYDKKQVITYKTDDSSPTLTRISDNKYYFNDVPFAIFKNNDYMTGDFERVIPGIDAYDEMVSDEVNDQEYFTNAYMVFHGVGEIDTDTMKQNRIISLPEPDDKVEFLTKDLTNSQGENIKNELDNNIYRFSKVVNMNDENFGNNASGISLKSKLQPMECLVGIKERKFKKGLQRRIKLIANINSLLGADFDYREIEIAFCRNLPTNNTEVADVVQKLSGIVSTETLLKEIPFIDDVQKELNRIQEENDKKQEENAFYQFDPAKEVDEVNADEQQKLLD